ncbi:MAG: VWA domain-containing protein [Terriglobales bacterium]
MPRSFRIPAVILVLLLAAAAQGTQGSIPVYRANVGEVLVQVSVLDRHGRAVLHLPQSDFTVYDNGALQSIGSFSSGDAPVSQGILVDNSGSMESNRAQVDRAALNFVRAGNPQDRTFIIKFNDLVHLVAPFTNNIAALESGLGSINPAYSTALYDALIRGAEYMNRYATRTHKVMLLISDGADDSSAHSLSQTERILQAQNSPMIYCIGLTDPGDDHFSRRQNEKVLRALASLTGGLAYFPKNLRQVNAITLRVARQIRQQYSFVYRATDPTPGYHFIRVVVRDPRHKRLRSITRRGYYR